MTFSALAQHLVFMSALSVFSLIVTWWLMHRVKIIDVPNARSSHDTPTPRSGGLAIVTTFFVGLALLWLVGNEAHLPKDAFAGFVLAALLIAGVSIVDDIKHLSFKVKLLVQVACAGAVMALGVVIDTLSLPGLGVVELGVIGPLLTLLWIVGLTNAFNFMDGLDGIAGGTALIAALSFAVVAQSLGAGFLYLMSLVIAAGCLGFLFWNWPPAKIFMGDSGSQFLGFVLAVMAVIAGRLDAAHVPYVVMPLLFFHFIWDTVFTMLRRWRAGEDITQAHRSHLYQLFNRLGYSHLAVTSTYLAVGLAQGGAAVALVHIDGPARYWLFLPFFLWQTVFTVTVVKAAKKADLL